MSVEHDFQTSSSRGLEGKCDPQRDPEEERG